MSRQQFHSLVRYMYLCDCSLEKKKDVITILINLCYKNPFFIYCLQIFKTKSPTFAYFWEFYIACTHDLTFRVVELTGDVTPDANAIARADVIVTTPEKWDGVSRSWQNRNYVKAVSLIVIDEIHLLGEDSVVASPFFPFPQKNSVEQT